MTIIDRGSEEIALVVDSQGCLIGTVTDGDIRRAILRGVGLESRVTEVMNPHCTVVGAEVSPKEVLTLMRARSLKQIPVTAPDGRLFGLHVWRDLVEPIVERPNWAVVMAGGEGQRLRPLTENLPKPMLQVGREPVLERIVVQLVAHGFHRIFLSVNYLGEKIEEYFADGRRFGCSIGYLREARPLGTVGALSLLPGRPDCALLVANGDLVTELNFSALMDYHTQQGHDATLCVREFSYQVPYGVVNLNRYRVVDMQEKPVQRFLINAGIYVLEAGLLGMIPPSVEYHMPKLLELASAAGKVVGAFPIREEWLDIGRLEDYELARQRMVVPRVNES